MTKIPSVEQRVAGYKTEIKPTIKEMKEEFKMFVPEDDGSASDWFEQCLEIIASSAEQRGLEKSQAVLDEMMEMARKEERQKCVAEMKTHKHNRKFITVNGTLQMMSMIELIETGKIKYGILQETGVVESLSGKEVSVTVDGKTYTAVIK